MKLQAHKWIHWERMALSSNFNQFFAKGGDPRPFWWNLQVFWPLRLPALR